MNRKLRCIVVDDNNFDIEVMKDHLNNSPYGILTNSFLSPKIFLTQVSKLDYDLLLLDICMPDIDGFTIAGNLPHKPIIFVTGEDNKLKEALGRFPLGLLTKPVTKNSLNHILKIAHQVIIGNSETEKKAEEYKLFNCIEPLGRSRIKLNDILYVTTQFEAHRNKQVILRGGAKYILSDINFEELLLLSPSLIRINKSEMISDEIVEHIENDLITLKYILNDNGKPKQVYLNRWFKKDFYMRIAYK